MSEQKSNAHPLAHRLLAELDQRPGRVLEIGTGSGRNRSVLIASDAQVTSLEADRLATASGGFDAALSTHALLHGTPATLTAAVEAIRALLKPGGRLYATFGSTRDARFGAGTRVADGVFAPLEGDEAGVAHTYWGEPQMRALLERFDIIELAEMPVDAIAGRWAHRQAPLHRAVHWMVVAQRPS